MTGIDGVGGGVFVRGIAADDGVVWLAVGCVVASIMIDRSVIVSSLR